jgi:hypothetical protein
MKASFYGLKNALNRGILLRGNKEKSNLLTAEITPKYNVQNFG